MSRVALKSAREIEAMRRAGALVAETFLQGNDMWLDAVGNPLVYYGQRDAETGAVECDPVVLSPGHPYLQD